MPALQHKRWTPEPLTAIVLVAALLTGLGRGAPAGAVAILFDFSHDVHGFFDDPQRVETLEYAGRMFERYVDSLEEIAPGGSNTWSANFFDPATGELTIVDNLFVPADTIIVYAGGRSMGSGTLGRGGFGAIAALSGSSAWRQTVRYRGQDGAPQDNLSIWGGSVAFNTGSSWHFDPHVAAPSGTYDFLSVAIHELGHVLGIGTAQSWFNQIDDDDDFTGPQAVAIHGGPAPVQSDRYHWANGTSSTVGGLTQTASMVPSIPRATRRWFTDLDHAALGDIGWEEAPMGDVNLDGAVNLRDAAVLLSRYQSPGLWAWTDGDLTGDGAVSPSDLARLLTHWPDPIATMTASPVPEPGTLTLLACSAAALLRRRR